MLCIDLFGKFISPSPQHRRLILCHNTGNRRAPRARANDRDMTIHDPQRMRALTISFSNLSDQTVGFARAFAATSRFERNIGDDHSN